MSQDPLLPRQSLRGLPSLEGERKQGPLIVRELCVSRGHRVGSTVAEPCGCDVTEHAQTLQAVVVQAGVLT